ncbi:MAG: T9SS type A sorting domain-containing protein, partial [Proteobacteria bacterium]|nr:T9SS type A sorting domain-containing protein [Pseudomonadota bacterium]
LDGSLMIRPVFRSLRDFVLATDDSSTTPEPELVVYPNPVQTKFFVKGHYNRMELVDFTGRRIFQSAPKEFFDVSALPFGIYFARFLTNERVIVRKIIVRD